MSTDGWTYYCDQITGSHDIPTYAPLLDINEELEIDEQSKFDNVAMSKIWRDLPLDIQKIIIDFLASKAYIEEDMEDEYDPVLQKPGVFSHTARAKSWNRLLAVGGYFSSEALRRLIRWDWWMFDEYVQFSTALKSWEIISPGCWNQIRVLTLGKIRLDGSNCQDIIDLCPEVSRFTNLTTFRIMFEVDEPISGHVIQYFDHDADLDETQPELFKAIEAVRARKVTVGYLKNHKLCRYLESVMTGRVPRITRQTSIVPYWRRDPELFWIDNWF